jgi:outer membrane protein assembly factor BamB
MHDVRLRSFPSPLAFLALSALWAAGCQGRSAPVGPAADSATAAPPATATATASAAAAASAPAAAAAAASVPALRPLWSVQTQGQTASLIDVAGDRVHAFAGPYLEVGSPTRWVMGLEASSGRVLWSKDMGQTIITESFLADGLLVLSNNEGKRTVLDAATGAPSTKKPPKEAPKPAAPALACNQADGKLACREGSAEKWKIPVAEPISQLTHPAGKVCFARARVRTIECRDAATGAILWSHTVPAVPKVKEPDQVNYDYRVVEGRLFLANYDGTIAALEVGK